MLGVRLLELLNLWIGHKSTLPISQYPNTSSTYNLDNLLQWHAMKFMYLKSIQWTLVNSSPSEYRDFVQVIWYDELRMYLTYEVNGVCLVRQRPFVQKSGASNYLGTELTDLYCNVNTNKERIFCKRSFITP